jgi:hypothetical protein
MQELKTVRPASLAATSPASTQDVSSNRSQYNASSRARLSIFSHVMILSTGVPLHSLFLSTPLWRFRSNPQSPVSRRPVNLPAPVFQPFQGTNSGYEHQQKAPASRKIDLGESCGARRVRGKRGRRAVGKTRVFGVLNVAKRSSSPSSEDVASIIVDKIHSESTICTEGWNVCDGRILNDCDHYRVYHNLNKFSYDKGPSTGSKGSGFS